MAVLIGHASIDENGKAKNGKFGDQTLKEVCTRDYYTHSKGWYVIRALDKKVAENIAKCMEDACMNNNVGYDQNQRNTLYNAVKGNGFKCDKSSLKIGVETDCSALVRVCVGYAGIILPDFYTGNERTILLATGKFEQVNNWSSSTLMRGDILVTKSRGHTVVVLTNGSKVENSIVKSDKTKIDHAKSFDKSLADTYEVTAGGLYLRKGAGKKKKDILIMPKGTRVKNYGYYTTVDGVKWLLIQTTINGVIYTGFASSKYLERK